MVDHPLSQQQLLLDRAKSTSVSSYRCVPVTAPQTLLLFDVTRFVQKHETAVKAAEAAVIEESMLSKDALSQAQAEFEKYSNVVKKFFF
jgi:hypothetical protein